MVLAILIFLNVILLIVALDYLSRHRNGLSGWMVVWALMLWVPVFIRALEG